MDFPELRGPIDLWSRGLLTDETPPPDWLDPSALYDAVRGSGVLVKHEIGYGSEGCFGGHVLELVLPSGGSRVVVVAGGPEMSNDHHPYYEVVFRRAGTQFTVDRTRVTFYDIAGIEGFEWPIMHAFFVLTAMLVVGSVMGVGTAILWLIKNFRYRDAH